MKTQQFEAPGRVKGKNEPLAPRVKLGLNEDWKGNHIYLPKPFYSFKPVGISLDCTREQIKIYMPQSWLKAETHDATNRC